MGNSNSIVKPPLAIKNPLPALFGETKPKPSTPQKPSKPQSKPPSKPQKPSGVIQDVFTVPMETFTEVKSGFNTTKNDVTGTAKGVGKGVLNTSGVILAQPTNIIRGGKPIADTITTGIGKLGKPIGTGIAVVRDDVKNTAGGVKNLADSSLALAGQTVGTVGSSVQSIGSGVQSVGNLAGGSNLIVIGAIAGAGYLFMQSNQNRAVKATA
jgi:hypothetical protein